MTAGTLRRLLTLTVLLSAALTLAACSGFSGFVADTWPTWAGGMPKGVPPRPGSPGYDEFMAHQQQHDAAAAATAPADAPGTVAGYPPPPGAATTAAMPPPGAPPTASTATAPPPAPGTYDQQQFPPAYARPDDRSTTQGGLY